MDKYQLRLTIEIAQRLTEQLEQALDQGDNKAIGARLYELKRTLETLAKIAQVPPFIPYQEDTQ